MVTVADISALIQANFGAYFTTIIEDREPDILDGDANVYPLAQINYLGSGGDDTLGVTRNFTIILADVMLQDGSNVNSKISVLEEKAIEIINKCKVLNGAHRLGSFSIVPLEEYSSDFLAGVKIDLSITSYNTQNCGTAPCVDPECTNGRGVSFVRIAGWDITTNGLDITVNDVTLQVCNNAQFGDVSQFVSVWNSGYELYVPGFGTLVFDGLGGNTFSAQNIADPQTFLLQVELDKDYLCESNIAVQRDTGELVPYLIPLQRPARLLEFDLRCTNATPNNCIMPYNYYFPDGDGTMNVDLSIQGNAMNTIYGIDTQVQSLVLPDTLNPEFSIYPLNDSNLLSLYTDYADPTSGSIQLYESINLISTACIPNPG